MLLGKRPRPPMKRTTSMSEFTLDLNGGDAASSEGHNAVGNRHRAVALARMPGGLDDMNQRVLATVSPRNHRRNSTDFMETADFLRSCGLCKRRLVPGRDIYMYRGDTAFCSLECRQQQMNLDERKEKCSLASKKDIPAATAGSQVSSKGETVTAV